MPLFCNTACCTHMHASRSCSAPACCPRQLGCTLHSSPRPAAASRCLHTPGSHCRQKQQHSGPSLQLGLPLTQACSQITLGQCNLRHRYPARCGVVADGKQKLSPPQRACASELAQLRHCACLPGSPAGGVVHVVQRQQRVIIQLHAE
jgi:hypothetical protein